MLRASWLTWADTLIDLSRWTPRCFPRGLGGHVHLLAQRGLRCLPFERYCRAQFRAVRWA